MTLQEMMIQYRAEHNVSQEKAAELVGINRQTWCNIESGRQDPSKLTEAKIMLLLRKEEE